MRFDWDAAKAKASLLKHGVGSDEVITVFGDVLSVSGRDLEHSAAEARFVTLGPSSRGRWLVVCFTHGGRFIRIISARIATRKEKRVYEEG